MPVLSLPVRDVSIETPRSRVVHLSLEGRSFAFAAGQYVSVGLAGQRERKPYSIASSPEESRANGALTLLIQVGADGSAGTHLGVPLPGMQVDVEGPNGRFVFPAHVTERDFLFVAGGTGIAPIRSMLRHAMAAFGDGRFTLVYSARTPDELGFGSEMRELASAGRLRLRETVTRDVTGPWPGERGRITTLLLAQALSTVQTLCFVCGPPALVDDVTTWLPALGIARERIYAEGW